MVRMIFGGDICPMGKVEKLFIKGNPDEIFHDLHEDIENADLSIANLECPLIKENTPIKKAGPVLGANEKCIKGIKTSGWKAMNLANNHSFDHGTKGSTSTITTLKEAGIPYFGFGMNIIDAQKPFSTKINGLGIAIYAMAEQEFSVATHDTPGSNPLDIINFINAIQNHKKDNIFIVLLHTGVEYYSFPTPETVRRCRFMIDMGADAVICCHSHCPLPWETYKGKPIVYGLGNLIFEPDREEPDIWFEGYLAELTIERGNVLFKPIPYFQSLNSSGVKKMNGQYLEDFKKKMTERCSLINQVHFLKNQWENYCANQEKVYLSSLFGHNRIMRKFSNFVLPILHPCNSILRSLLLVRCEAHREILDTLLRLYSKNDKR